jgi:hypothetical protein
MPPLATSTSDKQNVPQRTAATAAVAE